MSSPADEKQPDDDTSNAIPFGKPLAFTGDFLTFPLHPNFLLKYGSRILTRRSSDQKNTSVDKPQVLQQESFPVQFSASIIGAVLNDDGAKRDLHRAAHFVVKVPAGDQWVYSPLSKMREQRPSNSSFEIDYPLTRQYMQNTLHFSEAEIDAIYVSLLAFGNLVEGRTDHHIQGGIIRMAEHFIGTAALSAQTPGTVHFPKDYTLIERDKKTKNIRIHSKKMSDHLAYEIVFLLAVQKDGAFTVALDETPTSHAKFFVDKTIFETELLPGLLDKLGAVKSERSDRDKFYGVIDLIPYLSHKAFRNAFYEKYKTFSPALQLKLLEYMLVNHANETNLKFFRTIDLQKIIPQQCAYRDLPSFAAYVIKSIETARKYIDLNSKEIDLLMQLVLQTQEILLSNPIRSDQLTAYHALIETMNNTFKPEQRLLFIVACATVFFYVAMLAVSVCAAVNVFGVISYAVIIPFVDLLVTTLMAGYVMDKITKKLLAYDNSSHQAIQFWKKAEDYQKNTDTAVPPREKPDERKRL